MNGSVDNLYDILRNLGLSEEYIEFIRMNVHDSGTAQIIIDEINNNGISNNADFLRFMSRNFRLIPDLSRDSVKNTLKLGKSIVKSISEEAAPAENPQDSVDSDDVISVEAEVSSVSADDDTEELEISDEKENTEESGGEQAEIPEESEETEEEQEALSDSEVTQHTASLWKYKPINENEPENHEECISDRKILENAVINAASVRGKKHKHDGTNRDDWFETDTVDDTAIIAVADGAGSKKFSRIGAEISCKAAVAYIKNAIEKMKSDGTYGANYEGVSSEIGSDGFMKGCGAFAGIIQEAVICAYDEVMKAYEERRSKYKYLEILKRDMNFRDLSTTLILTLIIPVVYDGENQHLVISCQIGDGMVAVINNRHSCEDSVKLLGEADGGAFAGETDFLTSESMHHKENLMGRTKIARREISDVVVVTDGVADDYYPNATQISRLYTDLALNGIVKFPEKKLKSIFSDVASKLPEPVAYPWVNDNSIEVPLNYSKLTAASCGVGTADLWGEDRIADTLFSRLGLSDKSEEERLKIWLDNYVERGSFDDRTLVIYSVGGSERK